MLFWFLKCHINILYYKALDVYFADEFEFFDLPPNPSPLVVVKVVGNEK
jgi:hypothetical protein